MKTYKCIMGIALSAVMLFGTAFAANALSQEVLDGLKKKGQLSLDVIKDGPATRTVKLPIIGDPSRDCTDCEFDFTAYGSECCDSAWDEFGIDCATLEANYSWDCSGCACPGDVPCEDQGLITCEYGAVGGGNCAEDESGCLEAGECPAGQIADCDGSGECWPESWIGDGFGDCEDQAYGADLTCYDNDGGDCGETQSCADQGLIECLDGSCAATVEDCAECPAGTSPDCSGDGDCGFDTWIGDGYCDGIDQPYGFNGCCYDLDGGDCTEAECTEGGRSSAETTVRKFHKGQTLGISQSQPSEVSRHVKANKRPVISLASAKDGVIVDNTPEAVRLGQVISGSSRALTAVIELSVDEGYNAGFTQSWDADPALGEFTVYGFSPDDHVCATLTLCDNGACSNTAGPMCVYVADEGSQECFESDGCDGAGSGDVNGDGNSDVLDIVQIVNVILGGSFADECAAEAADINGDGNADVLDIVQIVNGILGRSDLGDATSGKLIRSNDALLLEANGYIGGIQMTLSHGSDFSLSLTENALVADYKTIANETKLVIVAPEGEELFTFEGDFEITDMIVANSESRVAVGAPTAFSLSEAYPNPFNPTTSMALSVPEAGLVSVQVYNVMGQVVATLASGYMDASTYNLTWDASNASSGMYFVKAETAGSVVTQKLVLMK